MKLEQMFSGYPSRQTAIINVQQYALKASVKANTSIKATVSSEFSNLRFTMITCILVLFLFAGCFGVPGRTRDVPLWSATASSELSVDVQPFKVEISEGDDKDCYFRNERKSIFETYPRNSESKVSTECESSIKKLDFPYLVCF